MDNDAKKRSIRFSDEEWDALRAEAQRHGVSMQRFIIERCLSPEASLGQVEPTSAQLEANLKKVRIGVRLLCQLAEDRARANGRHDDFVAALDKAAKTTD